MSAASRKGRGQRSSEPGAGARLVLGIDLGTSGAKALALAEDGMVRGSARVGYTALDADVGEGEQDPSLWQSATALVLAELGQQIDLRQVEALGLSGQTHGLVMVDGHGEALGPCLTWADARCGAEAAELRETLGDEIIQASGNAVLEAFTAPKMLWAKRHWPATDSARLCLPKDYLRYVLTDAWATDPSDAASTLLFDLKNQKWHAKLVAATGWSLPQLPPVQPSASVAGMLTRRGAALTGLRTGIPVITGASDVACAAFGAGLRSPGVTYLNVGTAAQLLTVAQPQPDPSSRFVFGHCLPDVYLAMGSIYAAGLSVRWFIEHMRPTGRVVAAEATDYRRVDRLAAAVPPGARGLMFLPYLTGSSLPDANPLARGAFVGLSSSHGSAECSRAILEGVGYALRVALDGLDPAGTATQRLVLGGGVGASRVWPDVLAGVLGRPISVLRYDSSPLGAAMLAGIGAGIFEGPATAVERSVSWLRSCEADPEVRGQYDRGYEVFITLRDSLRPVFAGLASLADPGKDGI